MTSLELPCIIVDWKKAPISMLFYRYCEDDEFSEQIGDRTMEGVLTLKRTLRIKAGHLAAIQLETHTLVKENGVWKVSIQNHGLNFTSRPSEQKASTEKYLPEITALIDPQQFDAMTRPESGVVEFTRRGRFRKNHYCITSDCLFDWQKPRTIPTTSNCCFCL